MEINEIEKESFHINMHFVGCLGAQIAIILQRVYSHSQRVKYNCRKFMSFEKGYIFSHSTNHATQ